jgi:hypothetical protein
MRDQESRFAARNSSLKLANNRDTQHRAKIVFHADLAGHVAHTLGRLKRLNTASQRPTLP